MGAERAVGFGYKLGWLALRDVEPTAVVAALGLRDLGTVPWRVGVDLAYGTPDRMLVTPPLPGVGGDWVLAAGQLLMLKDPFDVRDLSVLLRTEAQLFVTHRGANLHRWERAVDGTALRAVYYQDEPVHVGGTADAAEAEIGLTGLADDDAGVLVGERDVTRVAAAWSLDPTTLDGVAASGPVRIAATS